MKPANEVKNMKGNFTNQDHIRWALEVANQEYNGNLKQFKSMKPNGGTI